MELKFSIFKTGNGIIQTGNGIISPTSRPRPGNNSQLSGIPGFDSKIFCESAVHTTLDTASNMHKNAKFYEAE